jgi:hypothetical protein
MRAGGNPRRRRLGPVVTEQKFRIKETHTGFPPARDDEKRNPIGLRDLLFLLIIIYCKFGNL